MMQPQFQSVAQAGIQPVGDESHRLAREWMIRFLDRIGVESPYHIPIDGTLSSHATINGREMISFSGYNYLGLSGDSRVTASAKAAIDRYGTSVSASRLVAGERPLHGELERAIARWIGVDEALAFVSGHATNVTTIGCLFGPEDLILYDALSHNSIVQGIRLSGARARPFPHNNLRVLESLLSRERSSCRRTLIVTEGVFSMDGDLAPLPELIDLRNRFDALLMIDEAHSMGVLGATGRGASEHFGINPRDVDLWMGTLSKTFASCGGYIAGCHETVKGLRWAAPGHVYSCGMTPANAAAALEALRILEDEPERVARLRSRARRFRELAISLGFTVGECADSAVVPVICGSSLKALFLSHQMRSQGVLVHALFFPVVPKRTSRLRFFLTADHSDQDLDHTAVALGQASRDWDAFLEQTPSELLAEIRRFEGDLTTVPREIV